MTSSGALIVEHVLVRSSLSGARALAGAGWRVGSASVEPSLAALSRRVSAWHPLPDPADGLREFALAVAAVARDGGYEVVLPATDQALLALSLHRDLLPAAFPYAAHEVVATALDKLTLAAVAADTELPCPRTAEPVDDRAPWPGPALVKPRLRATPGGGPPLDLGTELCATPDEVAARVAEIAAAGGDAVVQEPVSGRLEALALVVDADGRPRATVQQEALHRWPADAGVSAYARTVRVEPELADAALGLLRRLGWIGLAQLQFLREPGGRRWLIDLNGRLYGSLALAVGAGANLPAIWAATTLGRPFPEPRPRAGVRFQWLGRDVRASAHAGGRVSGAVGALARAPFCVHTLWDRRDPGAAARYVAGRTLARGKG